MENETKNYVKNYYSQKEHNLRVLVENIDLDNETEINNIKREITKLQRQVELQKIMLSKVVELSYNKQYIPLSKKVVLKYNGARNYTTYYYDLESGVSTDYDTENDILYNIDTKVGNIKVVVGFDYDLASIIVKEYSYRISKDNDMITTKFLKEIVISFMEDKKVEYNNNTNEISENEIEWSDLSVLDKKGLNEFINTFYGVDYKGELTLKKLRESNLHNKSFEIILKTCPTEIIDKLLAKDIEIVAPIHKLLDISIDTYNLALQRNMIKELYENIDLIKGQKNNGIQKTEKEWLDFLEEMKIKQEDLDFYKINYSSGWYSSRNGDTLSSLILSSYCGSTILQKYYTLGKFSNYVIEETINQGYDRVYDFISKLTDYLRMCESDNIIPTLYSSYLSQTHDITSRNHKIKVEEEGEKMFASRYKDFRTYNNNKGYMVVAPKNTEDLKKEGDNLNHCVASYIKRVIDNECLIYFLRKEKDTSLITFEVRDNRIVQIRGLHNRKATQQEMSALQEFANCRKLEIANC